MNENIALTIPILIFHLFESSVILSNMFEFEFEFEFEFIFIL